MQNLLVTGGAGFIGSNFVRFWKKNYPEDRITVFDALTYAGNLENLKFVDVDFIKGNICDYQAVDKLFEEDFDIVVHFAAESHVDRSILGPQEFIETNIKGTFVLLESLRKHWKGKDKLFIHISTDEVYGSLNFDDPPFTEESPYRPNSPYSASKAGSDHLVRSYFHTYGIPAIVTHCSNNYGPYQFPEKLIPLMISNAIERKPLPIYGKGENIRDWIYVEDHCRAIEMVIRSGKLGETYNIGGNNEQKNIDVVRMICDIIDKKLGLSGTNSTHNLITFVADRPGHDLRYAIDITKIKRQLGWEPKESFITGLQKTVDWYLANQDWCKNIYSGNYRRNNEKILK